MSLPDAFLYQARACADLGSPFMERLMTLCGTRMTPGTSVTDRLFAWDGDLSPRGHSVPLRLAGALHGLKLDGLALTDTYPPHEVSDDALWDAVSEALVAHADRLHAWLDRAPQTNEVRRAAAILPALLEVSARTDTPLALIELGCSGGLNLAQDRFCLDLGETTRGTADSAVRLAPRWTGPMPPDVPLKIAHREGIDIGILDPTSVEDRLRLMAYLWPDQTDRIARTEAAIDLARSTPALRTEADAAAALPAALARVPEGAATVVYHTIAWQYFPPQTDAACRAALAEAAARATDAEPFAWISMENDGPSGAKGAALHMRMWPHGIDAPLGRADFHGRWIDWSGLPDPT